MFKLQLKYTYLIIFLLPLPFLLWLSNTWYHGDDFTSVRAFVSPWSDIFGRLCTKRVLLEFDVNFFRPFALLFRAIATKSGSVWFAHSINIFLHYLNAFILWKFLEFLKVREKYAFAGAFFFLTFSACATAVFWISGIGDLLATLFALITLFLSLKYLAGQKSMITNLPSISLFYLLAITSKEMALTLPLAIYVIIFFKFRMRDKFLLPTVLLSIATVFFIVRGWILGHFLMGSSDKIYFHDSALGYLINELKYIFMIVVPAPPHLFIENYFYIMTALPMLLLVTLIIKQSNLKTITFWIVIFSISAIPVCGIFSTWRTYYLSMIFVIGLTLGIDQLNKAIANKLLYIGFSISLFYFIICGIDYHQGGKFNFKLAKQISELKDQEIMLLDVPTSYNSVPLINSDHTIIEATRIFDNQKKIIQFGFFKAVRKLPVNFEFVKVHRKYFDFSLPNNKSESFALNPNADITVKFPPGQRTDRLKKLEITTKKPENIYIFKELP